VPRQRCAAAARGAARRAVRGTLPRAVGGALRARRGAGAGHPGLKTLRQASARARLRVAGRHGVRAVSYDQEVVVEGQQEVLKHERDERGRRLRRTRACACGGKSVTRGLGPKTRGKGARGSGRARARRGAARRGARAWPASTAGVMSQVQLSDGA
jgi:hypothetical protein